MTTPSDVPEPTEADLPLVGRTALVTGGSRGIGRAIALALAADGATVAINYRRDAESAAATVADIEALGAVGRAYAASSDVPDEVAAMAEAVQADLGPVDLLVCNAGIASRGGTVAQTELGELDRLMRTHVYGAFQLCGALLPGMRTRPRGDVVVISSVAARQLAAHMAPYGMAKVALEAMALTLAKEERNNGIHVNVVAPGLVDTEMGRRLVKGVMGIDDISSLDASSPFGRVCRPEDIAEVVRFLAGPSAGYVTGQIVTVDGGG
jgi:NAD(P)-dependent dehydrogenase (short-subunit alcohol dehydrogenase family)